ncbi:MAG: ABC transporter substrate-binding protein [Acidimicrobiales bacterium]
MSSTFDRRTFLTHSAATVGGVALGSTVVDGLLSGIAGAAVGVNKGKPKLGGTLTVGTLSDVPNYHIFNGSDGKLDASGFCVANALYDPLFVMSANGKVALPMLALSATPNASYTVWTIKLRSGVKFHNGAPFNAAAVVANYTAAAANVTVGLAIAPLITSVTAVDDMTVAYNMVIPFASFPITLAEQQISYMADPAALGSNYAGIPIGTGPFRFKSWEVGVESQFVKNTHYWRKDGAGRKLPYLDGINFKTIVDSQSRNEALESGTVDIMLQQTGAQIKELKKMKGISMVSDLTQPSDPANNFLIMNTTGTLNQYFCWAGEFASIGVPGALPYIEKGEAVPTAVQDADWLGTLGAVNPSTLQWDTTLTPVLNDLSIRQACAMAINRTTYFKIIDANIGAVANGLYRKTSPFYENPGYPAYNPTGAKALVDAYMTANKLTSVSFVIDILSGDATATQAFSFFQQQLGAVGITVTPRPLVQSTLINNVIYGEYDCATWNQFGGVDPSLNYVWFLSLSATASPAVGGLGLNTLPAGTNIAGAVNFAHQGDPVIEDNMLAALAAVPSSPVEIRAWRTVNSQFAKDVTYLWLDVLVNAWAARDNVQNWTYATGADGTTQVLSPDQGAARWDEIWLS